MKTVYRNVVRALLYADLRLGAGALAYGQKHLPIKPLRLEQSCSGIERAKRYGISREKSGSSLHGVYEG